MPPWKNPAPQACVLFTFAVSLAIAMNHYALELAVRFSL